MTKNLRMNVFMRRLIAYRCIIWVGRTLVAWLPVPALPGRSRRKDHTDRRSDPLIADKDDRSAAQCWGRDRYLGLF